MCNSFLLILILFIIRILFIVVIPIILLLNKKISKQLEKILCFVEILLIFLFVILTIFKNPCVINSDIRGFIKSINIIKYNDEEVYINNNPNVVEEIVTNEIYKTNNNRNVYYFNNYELPLSNKKYYCEDKEIYLKNYGNNITAISILLSTALDQNYDPIKVYNFAVENNLVDCEEGINTNELLNLISYNNGFRVINIDKSNISDYIRRGNVVLAKINNNSSVNNISCDKANIIIYSIDNENNFNILNPSNKDHDYICPDNTEGYGQIISSNTNDISWTLDELNTLSEEYVSLERN